LNLLPLRWPIAAFTVLTRWRRRMTLGVRVAVFDEAGRVFLIRHSYVPGWYFPGGGVEKDETMEEAMERELLEEGGIRLEERAELFGNYWNRIASRRDHVAFYIARRWTQARELKLPNFEIVEAGFFSPDALPADVTAGTRRRLEEIAGRAERSTMW